MTTVAMATKIGTKSAITRLIYEISVGLSLECVIRSIITRAALQEY